jgi:hypothetical protein
VILPLIGMLVGQMAGVLPRPVLLLCCAWDDRGLGPADLLSVALFERETILTRWKLAGLTAA